MRGGGPTPLDPGSASAAGHPTASSSCAGSGSPSVTKLRKPPQCSASRPYMQPPRSLCSTPFPVRMYLKQMGQVPLLTREQEVEISKRIENAELKAQEALFHASAVGGYIAVLGAKLLNREERFDRIVIDKKIESRDAYFRTLPKLVETTQKNEAGVAEAWIEQ